MNRYFFKKPLNFATLTNLVLQEGYTASYDTDLLMKRLKKQFSNRVIFNPSMLELSKQTMRTKFGIIYTVNFTILNLQESDNQTLQKILNQVGYFITKNDKEKIDNIEFAHILVEPKYPVIINNMLKKFQIEKLYHITHFSNLEKIQKIGLIPKGTETTYYHPDNRIYFIIGDTIILKGFRKTLSRDKKLTEKEFIILSTPFNDKYQYYIDESSTKLSPPNYYIGIFTLQNIPPEKITVENI